MKKLIYKNADLLNEKTGLLIHGCNCQGGFGSGIAGQIRKRIPVIYENYSKLNFGKHLLGGVQFIVLNELLHFANTFTQEFFGGDGKKYASVHAIESVLNICAKYCIDNNLILKSPKIGCGLGGLDWEAEVKPIYEKILNENDSLIIEIYEI